VTHLVLTCCATVDRSLDLVELPIDLQDLSYWTDDLRQPILAILGMHIRQSRSLLALAREGLRGAPFPRLTRLIPLVQIVSAICEDSLGQPLLHYLC
jgi:hypothetical protein